MSGLLPHIIAVLFSGHRPHDSKKAEGTRPHDADLHEHRDPLRLPHCLTHPGHGVSVHHAVAQDFPPDVTRGRACTTQLFRCHGSGGRGDGPDAAALRVPPMNFHRFTSVLKSDEELLRTIEHGVVFSSMHSWQGILTETEQQDALAYIRFLVQQGQ